MTKEFSLVEAMDDYLTKPRELYKSRAGLYPSEASVAYPIDGQKRVVGKCLRASYYRLDPTIQRDPDSGGAGLEMKALVGKWVELAIVDTVKKMGLYFDNSVKFFYPPLALSGELDMVITNPNTGGKILYEIKSFYGAYANMAICGTRPRKLKTKPSKPGVPGMPKDHQFLQSVLYSWEYKDEVEETRMLYVERGDGHRVEFRVGTVEQDGQHFCYWEQIPGQYWSYFEPGKKIQPYTIQDVHDRYLSLLDYVADEDQLIKGNVLMKHSLKGTPPPMDFEKSWSKEKIEWAYKNKLISESKYTKYIKKGEKIGDWQCSYCPYAQVCQEDFLRYGK